MSKQCTVYFNGPILTMDASGTTAEAIAVKDGKIAGVGDSGRIKEMAARGGELIDLQGRVMLPGFIDSHSHFYDAGLAKVSEVDLNCPPIGSVRTIADVIAALKAHAGATPRGLLIKGAGYDDTLIAEKRRLTRYDLDQVSVEHPIVVSHISKHAHFFNSKALAELGIGRDAGPRGDAVIKFDAAAGEPNGIIEEGLLWIFQYAKLKIDGIERRGVRAASESYTRAGVTTASSGGTIRAVEAEIFFAALQNGDLKNRLVLNRMIGGVGDFDAYTYDEMVMRGTVKGFYDGSIQNYTAYLSKPYYRLRADDPAGYRGYAVMTKPELFEMVQNAHNQGEQILFHANGDQAITDVLEAYENAWRANPRPDPRHVVIHAQMAKESDLDKMKELRVIPSFFSLHTYYWGDRHSDIFMGPERAACMSPAKAALERGIRFTTHCDTPVVPQEPLKAVWAMVNRLSTSGRVIGAAQRIDPYSALQAYTYNAAYQYRLEDKLGSLETGKWADMTILADNPLTCDPVKIKDIEVLETIVNGKSVYKR